MTHPDEPARNTSEQRSERPRNYLWPIVKRYLVSVLVAFVISVVATKIVAYFSIQSLREFNVSLIESVNQLNPWNLAKIFYGALLTGGLNAVLKKLLKGGSFLGFLTLILLPLNIPFAVYITLRTLIAEGLVSGLTALFAFLLGFLLFLVIEKRKRPEDVDWGMFWIYKIFVFTPLVGSCLMFVVLQLMRLASVLFGWALEGIETVTYFSVSFPLLWMLAKAAFKPLGDSLEDKVVGGMAEKTNGS